MVRAAVLSALMATGCGHIYSKPNSALDETCKGSPDALVPANEYKGYGTFGGVPIKDREFLGAHHVVCDGDPAYEARYKSVGEFHNGVAQAELDDGTVVFIRKSGESITVPLAGTMESHDWGQFTMASDPRFIGSDNRCFQFADSQLKRVYDDCSTSFHSPESDGYGNGPSTTFIVSKDGKSFHLDEQGQPLYDERYDLVGGFRGRFAIAGLDEKVFLIDDAGQSVSSSYDSIDDAHQTGMDEDHAYRILFDAEHEKVLAEVHADQFKDLEKRGVSGGL